MIGILLLSLLSPCDGLRIEPRASWRMASKSKSIESSTLESSTPADFHELWGEKPSIIIHTTVNQDYMDAKLFHNWVHYAKPFINSSMAVVFDVQEDQGPIREKILKMKLPFKYALMDKDMNLENSRGVRFARGPVQGVHYRSPEYKAIVVRRPATIQALLRMNISTLYVDLDTAWRKDPFIAINKAGDHDLLDTLDNLGQCTCFLFLKRGEKSIAFMQYWIDALDDKIPEKKFSGSPGNQAAYDWVRHQARIHHNIDAYTLPREEFPSGKWIKVFKGDPKYEPTVYHANFRQGASPKAKWFQENKMWNPDDLD